jgi:hypothetical protein
MTTRRLTGRAAAASLLACLALAGCTGGTESTAAEEPAPKKNAVALAQNTPQQEKDVRVRLQSIGEAIPVYAGARYRDDLTRRDQVMIRNQFGPSAEVYTLASDDSYPQVYHYYLTYLAQFRAFPAQLPYPPEQKNWRTFEVELNQAMQDSFIPGTSLPPGAKHVTLQIAETEAEPQTVIRYIVTPAAPPAMSTAAAPSIAPAVPAAATPTATLTR